MCNVTKTIKKNSNNVHNILIANPITVLSCALLVPSHILLGTAQYCIYPANGLFTLLGTEI